MASSLFIPSRVPYFAVLLFCALAVVLECVHHCLTAQKLCSHDSTCSALFYFVKENCGNNSELQVCPAKDALSCKAALKAIQNHKIFESPCICTDEASHLGLQCHQLFNYIFKNPCLEVAETDSSSELWTKAEEVLRAPSCTYAFKICSENEKCKQIYEYFNRHCRVIDSSCRPTNRLKCEEAVAEMQLTPMYGCFCWSNDERCIKIQRLINNNSCIDQLDRLASSRNRELWKNSSPLSSPPSTFSKFPPKSSVPFGLATSSEDASGPQVEKPISVHSSTSNPSITSRFAPEKKKTGSSSVIISSIEALPIYTITPSETERRIERMTLPPQDSAQITVVTSTCTWAQKRCEAASTCHILLENVYNACDVSGALCNRSNCMAAIRNLYHLGNPDKTYDIAFCNCKHDDESCLISQRRLHPVCATTIPGHMPGCDEIAEACKRREDCRFRLQKFEEGCAVNRDTLQCKSTAHACRQALVEILGTLLRTTCGCSGNNILSLYKCTDWQRIVWLNPCLVHSQREFLEHRMNTIPSGPSPDLNLALQPNTMQPPLDQNSGYPSNYSFTNGHNSMGTMATFIKSAKLTPSPPPPPKPTTTQYCTLHGKDSSSLMIRYGSGRRVYNREDPDCSSICMCDGKGELVCRVLPCDARIPCKTDYAVYSHTAPAYQAYRGRCICYSGRFICMKPSPHRYTVRQGIFLFLGYSELEERLLGDYTQMNINESIKRIRELVNEAQESSTGAVCKLDEFEQIGENIVMRAHLDEFEVERKNNSMTESMIIKERQHCLESLKNLTALINSNDPIIRNDVSLSLFKISDVEVNLKQPTNGGLATSSSQLPQYFTLSCLAFLLVFSSLTFL